MLLRFLPFLLALSPALFADEPVLMRVPNGGMKASVALDRAGVLHLVYFKGDDFQKGDAFYVRSPDQGATFSAPLRVNSQTGSVLAVASIRGPQLTLDSEGRAHVLWHGSPIAQPRGPLNPEQPADSPYNGAPVLYARLDDARTAFEPQRNLMRKTCALDGGGAITADAKGNIFAVFHALLPGGKGEADRAVFVAQSADRGATFAEEKDILPSATGACGCCALTARVTADGGLAILYRAAEKGTQRGMHLLLSRDGTRSFKDTRAAPWIGMTCPGSSPAILSGTDSLTLAWENPESGRVVFSSLALGSAANREAGQGFPRLGSDGGNQSLNAGPGGEGQKHPVLAVNERGETLLAWTEGTGWNRGGALAWEIVGSRGERLANGKRDGAVPPHGSLAAFTRSDGRFVILH